MIGEGQESITSPSKEESPPTLIRLWQRLPHMDGDRSITIDIHTQVVLSITLDG